VPDRVPRRSLVILIVAAWIFMAASCNYPGLRSPVSSLTVQDLRATLAAQAARTPESSLAPPVTQPAPAFPVPGFGDPPPASPVPGLGAPTPAPLSTLATSPDIYRYISQSGDTLPALALRFQVEPEETVPLNLSPPAG